MKPVEYEPVSPRSTTPGFRAAALLAAFASWVLVVVGGVVRVTESGLGCPDWPLCHDKLVPTATSTEAHFEFSHRVTAAVTIILTLTVAVWAWRRYRTRRDILVPALVAAGFIPGQALLGAVVVWLELPGWMVGVHFVIGLLFLATTTLAAAAAWPPGSGQASAGFLRLVRSTVAAGLALVSLGAAVVAIDADEACGSQWPGCGGSFAGGGSDAAVQVAHRMAAYAVSLLIVVLALQALRGRGPKLLGVLPLVAVAAQLAFGIALVLADSPNEHKAYDILHVGGSGAVWALVVLLAARSGALARSHPHAVPLGPPASAR